MFSRQPILTIRERAVRALEESTNILEKAFILLQQGRRAEADKMRSEARAKRNDSVWLMAKANELETSANNAPPPYERNPSHSLYH